MLKCVILIRTLLLDCQFWWEAQLKKKSGGCFHFMIKIGMGSFPGRYNRMKMEKSGFCMEQENNFEIAALIPNIEQGGNQEQENSK